LELTATALVQAATETAQVAPTATDTPVTEVAQVATSTPTEAEVTGLQLTATELVRQATETAQGTVVAQAAAETLTPSPTTVEATAVALAERGPVYTISQEFSRLTFGYAVLFPILCVLLPFAIIAGAWWVWNRRRS
jgi:hypothetical protein